jgi:hypothetical protein
MVCLTRSATRLLCTPEEEQALRSQFARRHCICLPELLDAGILGEIQQWIQQEGFVEAFYDVGKDSVSSHPLVIATLHFLVNDPVFVQFVSAVTGQREITTMYGRVYRMMPGPGHKFGWHSDEGAGRVIGISVNLSREAFSGGVFELRDIESRRMLRRVHNTGYGSAFLFRISPRLEHRVTPVSGQIPKTSFAGWFYSGPSYHSVLKTHTPA